MADLPSTTEPLLPRAEVVRVFEPNFVSQYLSDHPDPSLAVARVRAEVDAAAPETRRGRQNDLKHFLAFCDRDCLAFEACAAVSPDHPLRLPLPADPRLIAWYVDFFSPLTDAQQAAVVQARKDKTDVPSYPKAHRPLAMATMKRRVSSIAFAHRLFGLDDPTKDPLVTATMKSCFRKRGPQRQAHPIRWQDIEVFLTHFEDKAGHSPTIPELKTTAHWLRARALLLFAYDTAMRREELVRTQVESFTRNNDGSATVALPFSKTDQESEGQTRFVSVEAMAAIDAWTASVGIQERDLFCRFRANGKVLKATGRRRAREPAAYPYGEALSESEVNKIFKAIMRITGASDAVVNKVSGHSCRVGATLDLTQDGASTHRVQRVGGWKSPEMPARYAAKEEANRSAMADWAKHRGAPSTEDAKPVPLDAYTAYWQWYDFAPIAGSAVRRQQNVDGDMSGVDWAAQQQAMLTAGLSYACSLFEAMGRGIKWKKPHNLILTELRNALLHNGGDIHKNHNTDAYQAARRYLADQPWTRFEPSGSVNRAFFRLEEGMVTLDDSLFFFIQRLLDTYLTDTERQRGAPLGTNL